MSECPVCEGKGYVIQKKTGRVLLADRFRRVTCPECKGRGTIFETFKKSHV